MSKRHRKTRDMMSLHVDEMDEGYVHYDLSMYEAPKGKKPKGRKKRESHKRAYYDD